MCKTSHHNIVNITNTQSIHYKITEQITIQHKMDKTLLITLEELIVA